jgi:penicillin-binding protein 2
MRIMFERRLKIVLFLLFVCTTLLVLRAAQLQIVNRSHWTEAAAEALKREQPIETTRGTIYDVKGVPIAQDVACIDACVDYRAITDPPDEAWVGKLALSWARDRRGDEYRAADSARRRQIIDEERRHVLDRIRVLWSTLAKAGNKEPQDLEETRHDIIRRVEMRRRYVWYRKYELARAAHEQKKNADDSGATSWWRQWLIDETQEAPQLDQFEVKVAEQTEAHAILRAISPDVQNRLGKAIDELPGLVLRPGMTRSYPWGEAACHAIGHLSRVRREDLESDPWADDDLRKYQYNDLIGRAGLEALCEPLLRGSRGRIERYIGSSDEDKILDRKEPRAGQDITTTIDIALQQEILGFFQNAEVAWAERAPEPPVRRRISMHGGAVVIDVASGEVRALVSNPTFDPNTLDDKYADLAKDFLTRALISRATQYPLETGSTIKPVVGLGAVTQGVIGVNDGIECTGYLVIGGRRYGVGRCWVASKFGDKLGPTGVAHHPVPWDAPHRGHDGNADGFLTFSDALERSCNVYFETVAHRLGLEGLSYWMDRFGLGRPTGIGIEEARGRLPISYEGSSVEYTTWAAGIGQGPVLATPLQMSNVAATIARDGIWMRPTLLTHAESEQLRKTKVPTTGPSTQQTKSSAMFTAWRDVPDRVDLKLSPAGLLAAHEGMYRVVNSKGGTGTGLQNELVAIAGKTGTAQAARFTLVAHDQFGRELHDESGRPVREPVVPTTIDTVSEKAPWYIGFGEDGKNLKHSWIIGYAPASHPQIAFAVMVEYGGSGGQSAATIAKAMLDACIQHGYLSPDKPGKAITARAGGE